jgi:exopolysaccharide biosynthesis polyprenyl glycosylphosphotransferase
LLDTREALVAGSAFVALAPGAQGTPESVARLSPGAAPQPASKQALRLRLYAALVAADICCLIAAFLLANLARFGNPFQSAGLSLLAVILPVFLIAGFNVGAYGIEVLQKPRLGTLRSVLALSCAVCLVLLAAFFLKVSADFSRIVLALGTMGSVVLIVLTRYVFGLRALRRLGNNPLSEVVITDGVSFRKNDEAWHVDAAAAGLAPDLHDPSMLDRLGTLLRGVDRVLVTCPPERRAVWALALKGANVQGEVLAPELDEIAPIGIGRFGGRATLAVSCGPLDLRNRALKRLLDLAICVPVLIFLTPLMLATCLAIRLEDGGPVFFLQKRLGRGNRLFWMVKYRSMRADLSDHAGHQSACRDDQRVTRVGQFIRSTSIDELPQLFNVLRGDMSLVGPRPHALGSLAGSQLFWEVDHRYWHRHATKPGMTGLAQVRGFRGATHEGSDLTNRLVADLEYLSGWSIWRDVAILFRTFRVVVHKNAY